MTSGINSILEADDALIKSLAELRARAVEQAKLEARNIRMNKTKVSSLLQADICYVSDFIC